MVLFLKVTISHSAKVMLVAILNVPIFFLLSMMTFVAFNISSHPVNWGEYFTFFSSFAPFGIIFFGLIFIVPSYVFFLFLLKLPILYKKFNPWDIFLLCFLTYLIVSMIGGVSDAISIVAFHGADWVLAMFDLLCFIFFNKSLVKKRALSKEN